jgi:hypothetical protein
LNLLRSLGRQGLAEAHYAVAVFPLATGLEKGDTFETLEDIALCAGGTSGGAETVVLRHKTGFRAYLFGRTEEERCV